MLPASHHNHSRNSKVSFKSIMFIKVIPYLTPFAPENSQLNDLPPYMLLLHLDVVGHSLYGPGKRLACLSLFTTLVLTSMI